jgi:Sec-independent protein translocase protein TatA
MDQELPRSPQVGPGKKTHRRTLKRALVTCVVAAIAFGPAMAPPAFSATKKTVTTTKKKATTTVKKSSTTVKKSSASTTKKSPSTEETPSTTPSTSLTSTTVAASTKPPTSPPVGPSGNVTWFVPGTGKVLDLGAADVSKVAGGVFVAIDVRGQQGLAAAGTGSVILDVTAQTPTQGGRVTLTPVAAPYAQPVVLAQAQFVAGATTINRLAVPIGEDARIRVETTPGPQGLSIAVVGWVVNSKPGVVEARGFAMQPCRVVDSAKGIGLTGQVTPSRPFDIPATGVGKIPAASATPAPAMVLVEVTLSNATSLTSMNIVPTGQQTPALQIQAVPGNNPSGIFAIPVGADPRVAFYTTAGSANLTVDLLGYTDKDFTGFSAGPC